MEYEEIIQEINTDTNNEAFIDSVDSDSVSQTEINSEDNSVDVVESVLLLLEERMLQDKENDSLAADESASEESAILVQNVDSVDYSDILNSINEKLDIVVSNENSVSVQSLDNGIFTPLADYSLTDTLLLIVVIGLGLFASVSFIKNNVFKLR